MRSRALIAIVLGACGAGAREQAKREAQYFECKNRSVSYIASHHMAGAEVGVQMDCAEAGPRIKRWKTDKQGARLEDGHAMTPGEFDDIWRQIDGTGWPNLKNCSNGNGGKQAPVYVFDIKDDQNQATFECQTQSMPFPYNTIVDPLDVAAQKGGKQLGDDEPAELKNAEKKPGKK